MYSLCGWADKWVDRADGARFREQIQPHWILLADAHAHAHANARTHAHAHARTHMRTLTLTRTLTIALTLTPRSSHGRRRDTLTPRHGRSAR